MKTTKELIVRGKAESIDSVTAAMRAAKAAQDGLVQSGAKLQAGQDGVTRKFSDST